MHNSIYDELEAYRRKEQGLPPLKAILLGPENMRTLKQVVEEAQKFLATSRSIKKQRSA